jgi:hypothetical protein
VSIAGVVAEDLGPELVRLRLMLDAAGDAIDRLWRRSA